MSEKNTQFDTGYSKGNVSSMAAVYETNQLLNNKYTLMSFTGYFDHLLTTLILVNIKSKLNSIDPFTGVEKKVYSVLVECIENISKHATVDDKKNLSTVLIAKTESKYVIVTGNYIWSSEVADLKGKLDKVAKSTLPELKQMYRDQILSKRTDDNNAGLGIIDMAIKTGNGIQYDFQPVSEDTTFYLLQTEINYRK